MTTKEFILSLKDFTSILNKYRSKQKTDEEVLINYLAKIEKVKVERIKIKSILREKRIDGNTIIKYCVYERDEANV